VGKDINSDKGLSKRLMQSISARREAVIAKDGREVRKEDNMDREEYIVTSLSINMRGIFISYS
jgi:hypothetical protein